MTAVSATQMVNSRWTVEDLIFPRPKIVVGGDESAGKSSLIEGISGIEIPRNDGACIRRPFEINLTMNAGNEWSCKVYLYKKYMYEGGLGTSRTHNRGTAKFRTATDDQLLKP